MRFIEDRGFTVDPTKAHSCQQWIIANQSRLSAAYPPGSSLLGMFAAVFSSEKGAGEFHVLEQFDSYAALDRLAAIAKDPETEYAKLWDGLAKFIDWSPTVPWSHVLYKDALDVTVYNVE